MNKNYLTRIANINSVAATLLAATATVAHAQNATTNNVNSGRRIAPQNPNPLVTGRRITLPPLGTQFPVGSMPMNILLTPNGKFALVGDMGFRQRLTVMDTTTGRSVAGGTVTFDAGKEDKNGLYYGLAMTQKPDADGKYRVCAAQGGNDTIAVLLLDAETGQLTRDTNATIDAPRKQSDKNKTPGDTPAGIALDDRGYLFVANNAPSTFVNPQTRQLEQGSVSIYDVASKHEVGRYRFPANSNNNGDNGNEASETGLLPNYPWAVAVLHNGTRAYVSSQRDGKVYVLNTANAQNPNLAAAIVTGAHPDSLLLNRAQTRLFVANAHSDTVSIVDTATNRVLETVLLRPEGARGLPGATPTGLALSPDERTLYITLGDMNAVAVVRTSVGRTGNRSRLVGYIPTGWYPTAVVVSPDNKRILITNAKGVKTRNPNPGFNDYTVRINENQYHLNIIEGTVATIPIPAPGRDLNRLTAQVVENNRLTPAPKQTRGDNNNPLIRIGLGAGKIKHVIYIVKENRTYDQVLGDMAEGNGDPTLTLFGATVTPNQHALARRFVLLDNFYVCGEASGDGWPWSTRAFANEYVIKNLPYNYSGRSSGARYDFEGQNNGYLVGGHPAKDVDGKLLSVLFPQGAKPIVDISEGPNGTIWDTVRRASLSYRNYGFFTSFGVNLPNPVGTGELPIIPDNYPTHSAVQPEGHDLAGTTDYDFRRFDGDYADSDAPAQYGVGMTLPTYGKYKMPSRYQEWKREFDLMLQRDPTGNSVPAFMTVRFMNDHTEGLSPNKPSPKAQVADNDYAVGQLVAAISQSRIWESTAIFIVEDDSQSGSDHVDGHRSPCLVISPFVRRGARDSRFYNTDSVLRAMWLLLGCEPLSQYDATADPVALAAWDSAPRNNAPFTPILPAREIVAERNPVKYALKPGTRAYQLATEAERMNFRTPDSVDPQKLNAMIWESVRHSPMPQMARHGLQVAGAFWQAKGKAGDGDD